MDKWEASFISVLSQVQVRAAIVVSVSPPSSQCLAKLRPRVSLCTEGDNNTPPNPPLTALLTQSIPRGVGRCQVAVAKLWLPWQQGLGFAVMSVRCVLAVWALTRPTLVGDNEQDSAVMAMTLSVYEERSARGDSQLAWSVRGREWVGGWEWDRRVFLFLFVTVCLCADQWAFSATCKKYYKHVAYVAFS